MSATASSGLLDTAERSVFMTSSTLALALARGVEDASGGLREVPAALDGRPDLDPSSYTAVTAARTVAVLVSLACARAESGGGMFSAATGVVGRDGGREVGRDAGRSLVTLGARDLMGVGGLRRRTDCGFGLRWRGALPLCSDAVPLRRSGWASALS